MPKAKSYKINWSDINWILLIIALRYFLVFAFICIFINMTRTTLSILREANVILIARTSWYILISGLKRMTYWVASLSKIMKYWNVCNKTRRKLKFLKRFSPHCTKTAVYKAISLILLTATTENPAKPPCIW